MNSRVQRFSQAILLLCAAATIGAAVYAVWHRRAALADAGGQIDALLYYVLPLSLMTALLIAMAVWPRLDRLLMLLMSGSVLVGLVLADIYVGYLFTDEEGRAQTAAQHLGFAFDARSKAQIIEDLRAKGIAATPFVRIASDSDLVTLGVTPDKTVVVCNEFGPWFTPKTDRYGFVNPNDIWDIETPLDAVIVGDSFAMGQCDPTTGGVAGLLRAQGNRILNLGIGGNDPLLDLASLVEFGSTKKSRLLFWLHYAGNDLSGLTTNRNIPILRRYVDDPLYRQHLADRTAEITQRLAALEVLATRPKPTFLQTLMDSKGLARSVRLYNLRVAFGIARNIDEGVDFDLFGRTMKRAKDTAEQMGARLIVVSIPAAAQISHESVLDMKTENVVKNADIKYVDLRPFFQKTEDSRLLYSQGYTGHFSPDGNKLVAQILSGMIAEVRK